MSIRRPILVLGVLVGLIWLVACTMPASKAPTPIPGSANTQAVLTVVAGLTTTPMFPTVTSLPKTAIVTQPGGSPVQTHTPTATVPQPVCTPPLCSEGEIFYCSGDCPGGCGTTCATLTPTATPTSVLPPTATLDPSDPKSGLGEPTWSGVFDGSQVWYAYKDEHVDFKDQDKNLVLIALKAERRNGWALAPVYLDEKYYVEMTATFGACAEKDRWGLILSPVTDASRGYLFGVSCAGNYILWEWDGSKMVAISDWASSTNILGGARQTNTLGIKVEQDKLSLFANGKLLKQMTDATYDKRYFGVFIGSEKTANFTVTVSALAYWPIP
jgi:hypothetical protein